MVHLIQNLIIAGAVIGQILVLFLIFAILFKKRSVLNFIHTYVLHIALFLAATATASSLFYSIVVGLQPCLLCWWQRIALFPQVILFTIATIKKDLSIRIYGLWLSFCGAVIAAYQYYEQITYNPLIPCPVVPGGVSCLDRQVFELGYITIPLMSLTVFLLMGIILWISLSSQNQARTN